MHSKFLFTCRTVARAIVQYAAAFALIACVVPLFAQQLPPDDKTRIAEFYRFAAATQDKLWPNWSNVPAPLLLLTKDGEFLTHGTGTPAGFKDIGDGYLWGERRFPLNMMATFPALGMSSVIVIGEPANTDAKTSTSWILFAMHEHFHQLQNAQPSYSQQMRAKGLYHGPQTGIWIVNFPFPYEDAGVNARFDHLRDLLLQTLAEKDEHKFHQLAAQYVSARKEFMDSLSVDNRNYLEFEFGIEGIARYMQVLAAEAGASYQPSKEFTSLPDYTPFSDIAAHLRTQTLDELRRVELATAKRTAAYPFGAAEGMLLDRLHPDWKAHYFEHMFDLGELFTEQ